MSYFSKAVFARKQDGRSFAKPAGKFGFVAILALFAGFSSQATNWYVDNAVSGGAANGTSWASAWPRIGSVSWGSVHAGDTVYISGGSSSQVYSESLSSTGAGGTTASPVTISTGQDAGHNGKVIIDGTGLGTGVQLGSHQHLTGNVGGQTNFAVRNLTSSSDRNSGVGISGSAVGLVIDHVEVYSCNNGMSFSSPTPIVISNCFLHDIRGDRGIGVFGTTGGYDANLIHDCTIQLNSFMNGAGDGPDGIQGTDGVSVYNCNIYAGSGTVVTSPSSQHMDGVQFIGNHWKIYNNTMTDLANSCCEGGCGSGTVGYYMIYNNLFRIVTPSVNAYQRGIEWSPNGQCTAVTDVYICNNTHVDMYGYYAINWIWQCSSCQVFIVTPTINNFVVKNNIYYNSMPPYVASESGASAANFSFDYNAVYAGANGSTAFSVFGSTPSQPHLRSGNVQFVSYSSRNANNNLHLKSTDTIAQDQGTSLATLYTTDKEGNTRPQGTAWDIGAYEFQSGAGSTNPVISVSSASLDFGAIVAGTNASRTFTVQNVGAGTLTGTASVAAPYSIVSGANYSLGAGLSQPVTVLYSPTAVGTNNQNLTLTGGGGTTVSMTGSAYAPLSGLVFQASAGSLTTPFAVTGSYISQGVQTGVTNGGRATYAFTITNAGNYVVQAMVNAPDASANSFYVNIDAEPTDPYMTWQISTTTGFESRLVSWQGTGTYDNSQFAPEIFTLSQGAHQLIIRGREMNAQLQTISILKIPSAPAGLRIVPGS